MNSYTEEYYKTSNYSDYSERGDRYFRLAKETTALLESIGLIDKESHITDFGCATGHLLVALKSLGYTYINGVEISDWARSECIKKGLDVYTEPFAYQLFTNFVYALDVLEHMTDNEVEGFFNSFPLCPIIIRIPVASVLNGPFHLEVSRKDPTHINCKTTRQWMDMIRSIRGSGTKILKLNLNTIYDSEGVFCAIII